MNNFLHSRLLQPVVRQARRFSGTSNTDASDDAASIGTPSTEGRRAAHFDFLPTLENSEDVTMTTPNAYAEGNLISIPTGHFDIPGRDIGPGVDEQPVQGPPASHDPAISPQNGFQGLISLDDVRSNYMFDSPPVLTPGEQAVRPSLANSHRSGTGVRTLDSLASEMSLDDPPRMSINPATERLRSQPASLYSNMSRSSAEGTQRGGNMAATQVQDVGLRTESPAMTNALPEDDGMRALRVQLQQIHEMALSAEDKAKRMHELMVSDYKALQQSKGGNVDSFLYGDEHLSPRASLDGAGHQSPSVASEVADLIVTPEDLRPTHRPRTPSGEAPDGSISDDEEEERPLGCKHYIRNIKVNCSDCRQWYTCRHCHDEAETHILNRKAIANMLCLLCGHPQRAGDHCKQCGEPAATYYCDICKLWDSDPRRKIYHCPDCGICRRGEGLGKDYVHCKKCNVCISIAWSLTHRCIEKATECGCPICSEYMFTSSTSVVAMRCGHYIHRKCYDAYMQTSYKCPICNRSAVNMELQWRKLDRHIEGQPMPSQFKDTKAWITCNDCTARSCTAYHWLGNKCLHCDSYNTNEIKLVNSPTQQEMEAMSDALAHRERMVEESGIRSIVVSPIETPLYDPPEVDIQSQIHQAPALDAMPNLQNLGGFPFAPETPIRPSQQPSNYTLPYPYDESTPPHMPPNDISQLNPLALHPTNTTIHAPIRPAYPLTPPLGLQEQAPSGTNSLRGDSDHDRDRDHEYDENLEDDAPFWGEPISPPLSGFRIPSVSMPNMPALPTMPNLPTMSMPTMNMPAIPNLPTMSMPTMAMPTMPTLPRMPSMPDVHVSMPTMPQGWNMPRMPSMPDVHVGMPTMPSMGMNGWTMPTMAMPNMPSMGMGVPVSVSPMSGWSSPRFFAARKVRKDAGVRGSASGRDSGVGSSGRNGSGPGVFGDGGADEDGDADGEEESGDDDDRDSDDDMNWGGEEEEDDGDVDEMELFGHR